MKVTEPKNIKEISSLLTRLNLCHDGVLQKICFLKNREVDEKDGSIIYPFENIKDLISCDVEIEMILNSYSGARKDQIILFRFEQTLSFSFAQNENFDCSDIFELEFKMDANSNLYFIFYSTKKKIKFLTLMCKKFICKEL